MRRQSTFENAALRAVLSGSDDCLSELFAAIGCMFVPCENSWAHDGQCAPGCAPAGCLFFVEGLPGLFAARTAGGSAASASTDGSASISPSALRKCSTSSYDSSWDSTRRQAVRPNSSNPA